MLTRVDSFFEFFRLDASARRLGRRIAGEAAARSGGMTHVNDYEALAAIALAHRPKHVFEIGTYLGVTSDFFLQLLPDCRVVSIAYINPPWRILGPACSNSGLSRRDVGSSVCPSRRGRFTQLIGSSHNLKASEMLARHGSFDLVFIDGDHTREAVALDTELAHRLIGEHGAVCWHDANPKPKYMDVREFLESGMDQHAIATRDDFVGGVACWSRRTERELTPQLQAGSR